MYLDKSATVLGKPHIKARQNLEEGTLENPILCESSYTYKEDLKFQEPLIFFLFFFFMTVTVIIPIPIVAHSVCTQADEQKHLLDWARRSVLRGAEVNFFSKFGVLFLGNHNKNYSILGVHIVVLLSRETKR